MKKRMYGMILVAEAVFCILFCIFQLRFSNVFTTIAAFPLEQIGKGLRWLSLTGGVGNGLAILIFVVIGLIPWGVFALLKKSKRICAADICLIGISILLWIFLYFMINPGLFGANVPGSTYWMLGCTFYSAVFGYLVVRFIRQYTAAGVTKLQNGFKLLLFFLNVVFVYLIFGQSLGKLFQSVGTQMQGNGVSGLEMESSGISLSLGGTYVFLILHFLVTILPYVLDMVIVAMGIRSIEAMMKDRYSEETVTLVKTLADFCKKALIITVIADVIFNLLQVAFHRRLYQMDIVIVIPVFSIVFVFAMLLLAHVMQAGQKLKQDNDLFI